MIQIAIWLGCVYLVFKGVSILQTALASQNENKNIILLIGWGSVLASLIAAFVFFNMSNEQAAATTDYNTTFPY